MVEGVRSGTQFPIVCSKISTWKNYVQFCSILIVYFIGINLKLHKIAVSYDHLIDTVNYAAHVKKKQMINFRKKQKVVINRIVLKK